MSLCKTYFGKEREELTYDDIENYFTEAKEESDKIEFKSYSDRGNKADLYDPVCKTISAFLNSAGGILIWGAPEGQEEEGKKEKVFRGDLAPIDFKLEQDALVSKVSDLINPLTNDIKLKILDKEDKYVCVFEIDKSIHTAHQFKNIYYMRLDGQTRIAPHHYIEALMKQIKFPNLEGYLKINSFNRDMSNRLPPNNVFIYKLSVALVIYNWSKIQNELNLSILLLCDKHPFEGYNLGRRLIEGINYYNSGHTLKIECSNV